MSVSIVFETHATSEDNEAGRATGWLGGRLSKEGRLQAAELGERRCADGIDVVASSDLARARETVEIAFASVAMPVLYDWRLRECDYGELNGADARLIHSQLLARLDDPFPGGESWTDAVERVQRALTDLAARFDGRRVLVVGHMATRWGLEALASGRALAEVVTDASWQPGWEFVLGVAPGT